MFWFCKKRPVKCIICKNFFYNRKYKHKDNVCLKCFDKILRRNSEKFYTLTEKENNDLFL